MGIDGRPVAVVPDPHPEADLFIRSDQYSFVKAGVPSVFGNVGFTAGSAEDRLLTQWQRDRYHAPSDDLEQPINGNTVSAFSDFTEDMALKVDIVSSNEACAFAAICLLISWTPAAQICPDLTTASMLP